MKPTLPRWRAALAAALLCVPLVAPAQTLRWSGQADILALDPHAADHGTTNALLGQCYEPLVRFNRDYQLEPALATRWTQISPKQIRFELRKGVRYHDGSPFSADDVVFSHRRALHPNARTGVYLQGVAEVRRVDSHTVDFMLDAPNPALLRTMTNFFIMNRAWAEKHKAVSPPSLRQGEEGYAVRHANGTGPYRVTSWQPESRLSLEQNADWWDRQNASNVKEAIYMPIKSDQTRIAALMSGEVDLLSDVPTQDVARLRSQAGVKVLDGNEARTIYVAMDVGSETAPGTSVVAKNPFKDARVREALSLAIDRNALQRVVMRGLSTPAATLVAPAVQGYDKALDAPAPPDTERARQLLAEAGYVQGFEISFQCPNNRYVNDEELCTAIVPMWARIGIRAKLKTEPFSSYSNRMSNREMGVFLAGWGNSVLDAHHTLTSVLRTQAGKEGLGNYSRISDPALDALIDAARIEMDAAKRTALVLEAQQRAKAQMWLIPLHHQMRPWAMKPGVTTVHRVTDQPWLRLTTVPTKP
ncbi:MAG: ABC transporter substrate-binding protein [Burkholderiales bacterium]|uniref:ABC transporter substrate-binding protein n=1 Tax=Inhella sp. TaxID=1921806 RepID=UPI001AC81120|nr:ABC transporter substrate-binding protein [Burkholderiales bacterium]